MKKNYGKADVAYFQQQKYKEATMSNCSLCDTWWFILFWTLTPKKKKNNLKE